MNKAHILQEIVRTAEANSGVPLGRDRFQSETGIRESDWHGKYWIRWSDAVREAGFVPNRMSAAYDKADLLDKYARLARELGRLPVRGDLLLKARSDSSFPSKSAFERFGRKAKLIKRLLEYCGSREGYEDVARLCEEHAAGNREVPDESARVEEKVGFVYLIKSGRFYKIGKTNAAGRREYELAIQLPEKVKTIHVIRTDDPSGIEAYWHKRFEAKRKKGEWFELGAAVVAAFKRRKFM
jgi:hypothetical protein